MAKVTAWLQEVWGVHHTECQMRDPSLMGGNGFSFYTVQFNPKQPKTAQPHAPISRWAAMQTNLMLCGPAPSRERETSFLTTMYQPLPPTLHDGQGQAFTQVLS